MPNGHRQLATYLRSAESSLVDRLAGAVLAVQQLDTAAAWDGGAHFVVCFMLVVSGALAAKSSIHDCLVLTCRMEMPQVLQRRYDTLKRNKS